ncbi:hypothetical protein P691DRAFT_16343 [Macrolepiota fuliginosa MF-IS2]|uniref:Uncharacterized protein n=1 Tax=Macrolepiota fuliginosa MF-IS2 TaxID=1400762 RepID=A0A9P6CBI1_9AGAR|nr:hypothetical protein P691DRAFT_16343 [Macrolepiota fuliginosa MF-IS2]
MKVLQHLPWTFIDVLGKSANHFSGIPRSPYTALEVFSFDPIYPYPFILSSQIYVSPLLAGSVFCIPGFLLLGPLVCLS